MGLLTRVIERITSVTTDDDLSVDDATHATIEGLTPVAETLDRHRATVQGRVRGLTLPTAGSVTALIVDLADRTGSVNLVFIGRQAIPGIECGVMLRVEGLVSTQGGTRVMYNPVYEIVPSREH